jgi:hypothetical protein
MELFSSLGIFHVHYDSVSCHLIIIIFASTNYFRYNFLSKKFGAGVGTGIVLKKCICDQLFFATQQDGLFLGLCAFNDSNKLPQAIDEVKRTFLTTWIADCSIWPVVNFFGFAFVPSKLQPTYMASIQFFWQVYLSSMAAGADDENSFDRIEEIFRALDDDSSGFIDAMELEKELKRRGLSFTKNDLKEIMAAVDENGDGKISFEEFKNAIESGAMKKTVLWGILSDDLQKGAKAALKRLENLQSSTKDAAQNDTKDIKDREDALKSAAIGGSAFISLALIRKFILKI